MDSSRQPGDAKPQTAERPGSSPPIAAARRYPKPPALWQRFILFTINPETWPMAARYPTRFTLIVLALAIILGAASAGIGDGVRWARSIKAIGEAYAKEHYPTMELTGDGVLTAKGDATFKWPIEFSLESLRVVVDPTKKTTPDAIKMPGTLLITDRSMFYNGSILSDMPMPLTNMALYGWPMPQPGQTSVIDGEVISSLSNRLGCVFGIYVAIGSTIGNFMWAAMMMFLLCPLIMLVASAGERGLILPKRAAYRMAAAFLVPLVLFSGLMHAAGYSIVNILGPDFGMMFWFFTAAGIAVWTGILARHQFGPPAKRKTN